MWVILLTVCSLLYDMCDITSRDRSRCQAIVYGCVYIRTCFSAMPHGHVESITARMVMSVFIEKYDGSA